VLLINGDSDDVRGFHDRLDLNQPISVAHDSTCEVLLITGAAGAVVFRAAPAVMNAQDLQMWALDVFRALRGEDVAGERDPIGAVDALGKRSDKIAELKAPVHSNWLLGPPPTEEPAQIMWRRRAVDGYHPALAAKVATAIVRSSGWETCRFQVEIQASRLLSGVSSTAFQSEAPCVDIRADQTWEETHRQLLKAQTGKQDLRIRSKPWLRKVPQPLLRLKARGSELTRPHGPHPMALLSQVARLDTADFTAPSFVASTVYPLPIPSLLYGPSLAMVEVGGRTEFTLAWYEGPNMAARIDAVLDCIAEQLSPKVNRCWDGNDTELPIPADTVVALFRRQASKTPEATALRWPDGEMSFAELDHRSDTVAAELNLAGAGKGDLVGLLADRSAAAITGMWGVLKAGAAYLPLDCHHPDARIAAILADANVEVCLVQQAHAQRDYAPFGCVGLILEDLDYSSSEPQDRIRACPDPDPDDLAYVVYTSGSTGTPKGVEISHRSLTNYVGWARSKFDVDSTTSFALFTSMAFDLPHTAVFLSVLGGAALVLVPDEPSHLSLKYLVETSGANALKLTPSHLDLINRLGLQPRGFKVLVVGGELLRPALAERAQQLFGPQCRIFNHYGPTEVTVGCLVHAYDSERDGTGQTVPIGRPVANTNMVLLDPERRFVAAGEAGEMYLGGAQVARGYRGRPDLDREKFVQLADGRRAYRSGDIARVLPSGEVEFLGRVDDQLKILGHRIEPAEIAQALEGHPDVARAVVIARNRPGQDVPILCAYIVAEHAADSELTVAELEAFASERLPRYMVPGAIMIIDLMPQTTNGKLDIRVLPDPFAEGQVEVAKIAPRDDTPRDDIGSAVATIWARILQLDVDQIDGRADFHQLGGNSLLMLEMLAGVCTELLVTEAGDAVMAQLEKIIREPTLDRVSELAREARADYP
jgi:amino acid adenylation domain-containing protein